MQLPSSRTRFLAVTLVRSRFPCSYLCPESDSLPIPLSKVRFLAATFVRSQIPCSYLRPESDSLQLPLSGPESDSLQLLLTRVRFFAAIAGSQVPFNCLCLRSTSLQLPRRSTQWRAKKKLLTVKTKDTFISQGGGGTPHVGGILYFNPG